LQISDYIFLISCDGDLGSTQLVCSSFRITQWWLCVWIVNSRKYVCIQVGYSYAGVHRCRVVPCSSAGGINSDRSWMPTHTHTHTHLGLKKLAVLKLLQRSSGLISVCNNRGVFTTRRVESTVSAQLVDTTWCINADDIDTVVMRTRRSHHERISGSINSSVLSITLGSRTPHGSRAHGLDGMFW